MRYELTIDASYVGGWDLAEGVREFIQNGRDAEIEQSAPLTISFRDGVIRIENEGATLTHDALLLGRSSKRGNSELLGKWGEGLKLGALALVRRGFEVTIRNGGEVWKPAVEESEKFGGRRVLVFHVAGGRSEKNRVRVEIGPVPRDNWDEMRKQYLWLAVNKPVITETRFGSIIRDEAQRGRIYVKGIYVQSDPTLQYGYDLKDADLDRDRRIIAEWDLRSRTKQIWIEAVTCDPDMFGHFYALLASHAPDLAGLQSWNVRDSLPESIAQRVVSQFEGAHGKGAVPVTFEGDVKELEKLGVRGVVVPQPLAVAISKIAGDTREVTEKLRTEVLSTTPQAQLSLSRQVHLRAAVDLVRQVIPITLDEIDVVAFRSERMQGQVKDGRILLSEKLLDDSCAIVHVLARQLSSRALDTQSAEDVLVEIIRLLWK